MAIMRSELRASGSVRSTWPSAAKKATPAVRRDPVEVAGDESFPASDPPSWTLGTRHPKGVATSKDITRMLKDRLGHPRRHVLQHQPAHQCGRARTHPLRSRTAA